MGKKAKSSRKGKKAWRANIRTDDIDDFIEKSTKDALSGGSLSHVPTDSLFFVDKSKDLSVRRKIEKHREKVLRCDSVLKKNPFVHTVPSSNQKKKHNNKTKKTTQNFSDPKDDGLVKDSVMVDLWENEGFEILVACVAWISCFNIGYLDMDSAYFLYLSAAFEYVLGEVNNRIRKRSKPSVIPAVEVEPPGCSYNPSFEAHQDSLAQAVAEEMQKVYKSELGPQPVPLTVPEERQVIDEEDADNGDDDEEILTENEDTAVERRSNKTKRVTRVKLNRRTRLKERKKKEAEAKKKEELSKEIDFLPAIINEIAKEDEEKNKRHIRRVVAKQERLKTCPPRLGKHKFEPAPPQVLLSEEITGSLRNLKGCCTLLKDRFKSLEKRGLIAPAAKSRRR